MIRRAGRRIGAARSDARAALGRLWGDRRGGVLILTGAGFVVLTGFASIGIDLGGIFLARRQAQGAADLAALVAAANPAQADALARRSLADNGYGDAPVAVRSGLYRGEGQGAPAERFEAGAVQANAVQIALQTAVRTHFGRLVGLPRWVPIQVTSTAAQAQFAALGIGSGTAALNGGVVNALLGAMLGTRLSLSALDYNALLASQVDVLRFLDALATSLDLEAGGYASVLQARARLGQIVSAARLALQGEPNAAPAIAALGTLLGNLAGSAGPAVPVSQVVDLGDVGDLSPGRDAAGARTGLLDLIADAAAVANGQRQVSVDLGAAAAGLIATRLTLAVGERRQSSGWAQPGSGRATVSTAQTRLLLEVTVAAPLGLGNLYLPLYAEVAPARATLRALTCPWASRSERRASVEAQPGLLDLAVADVPPIAIALGTAPPDLRRGAALISLPAVTVRAQARASLAPPAPQTLVFSDSDIARGTFHSVASTSLTQSLTGSLFQSLSIGVDGLDPGTTALLRPLLTATLSSVAPAVDGVLDSVLRTVGIRLGYAEVTVGGTLCSSAVLVQ